MGPVILADTFEVPIQEETTMFKTISAALIAASVLAAPAFAATTKSAAKNLRNGNTHE